MYKVAIYTNFPLTPTPGYMKFFETIFDSGKFELVDVNNPLSANFAICFNHTKENLEKVISSRIPVKNRVLVMLECKQILPVMHTPEVLEEYGIIFTPSPNWEIILLLKRGNLNLELSKEINFPVSMVNCIRYEEK